MTGQPLISIITITFNAEKVICPTIESISRQTFRNFEHLVIDGASTDSTIALVRRNGCARILSEPDRGLYDAMNKGLRLARGKYLLFLNAGDTFHSADTLGKYAERALAGDDIIYADTVIVGLDRKELRPRHLSAPALLTFESFAQGMLVCHQAFMVRAAISPEYDLTWRFSADYDWTIRCIKASDPRHCTNLGITAIDYLSDGMTDRNKYASLLERFRTMTRHYGTVPTLLRHFGFLLRALRRR